MDHVVSTLFMPFVQIYDDGFSGKAAFFNAFPHESLSAFKPEQLFLQQGFKPYADILECEGFTVSSEILDDEFYDTIFIALPKNMIEAKYLIAKALKVLNADGQIFCAADNKAGGNRIKKMLQGFGLKNVQELSKNKARVVWASAGTLDQSAVDTAIVEGSQQSVLDGEYQSIPGVFGWHKIDQGSAILAQHLPDNLSGKGADFGCGYGFLSRYVAQHCVKVKMLYCIDADVRAVKLCEENLKDFTNDIETNFLWQDLTRDFDQPKNLDFIVMNPPFHDGKKADKDIGKAFIQQAFQSLKPRGRLFIVANVNLPYENILKERFFKVEKLYEGRGFKVYCVAK